MTTVLHLPDDVAALLEARAAERGLTVTELVSEMARRPRRRPALDAFIGCADITVGEPFDLNRARTDLADELLREHDDLSVAHAERSSPRAERSLEVD